MGPRASPLDNEQCKQCTSFADYVKQTKKKQKEEQKNDDVNNVTDDTPIVRNRNDCPLDKDELGNKSWGLLHTIAAKYPEKPSRAEKKDICSFLKVFSRIYPCPHCAADFREQLKVTPPKVESQESLSQWLCEMHNRVNEKLNKPIFDCSKVNERWRDGWLDGSCD